MEIREIATELARADAELASQGIDVRTRAEILTGMLPRVDLDSIPGLRLDTCGRCGGNLLVDLDGGGARCSAGCGWVGRVLRVLP